MIIAMHQNHYPSEIPGAAGQIRINAQGLPRALQHFGQLAAPVELVDDQRENAVIRCDFDGELAADVQSALLEGERNPHVLVAHRPHHLPPPLPPLRGYLQVGLPTDQVRTFEQLGGAPLQFFAPRTEARQLLVGGRLRVQFLGAVKGAGNYLVGVSVVVDAVQVSLRKHFGELLLWPFRKHYLLSKIPPKHILPHLNPHQCCREGQGRNGGQKSQFFMVCADCLEGQILSSAVGKIQQISLTLKGCAQRNRLRPVLVEKEDIPDLKKDAKRQRNYFIIRIRKNTTA